MESEPSAKPPICQFPKHESKMKQIIFIQHALDRLEERGISKELVIEIIRNPDKVDLENERRKIAHDDEDKSIVVISAYSTSKIQKYLGK